MKICKKHLKFTKVSLNFCQILNKPLQNDQSFLTSCLSGEISPNLVTLPTSKKYLLGSSSYQLSLTNSLPVEQCKKQLWLGHSTLLRSLACPTLKPIRGPTWISLSPKPCCQLCATDQPLIQDKNFQDTCFWAERPEASMAHPYPDTLSHSLFIFLPT